MAMTQLVYYSKNTLDADDRSQLVNLREILEIARRKNGENGVTGYLIFDKAIFCRFSKGIRMPSRRPIAGLPAIGAIRRHPGRAASDCAAEFFRLEHGLGHAQRRSRGSLSRARHFRRHRSDQAERQQDPCRSPPICVTSKPDATVARHNRRSGLPARACHEAVEGQFGHRPPQQRVRAVIAHATESFGEQGIAAGEIVIDDFQLSRARPALPLAENTALSSTPARSPSPGAGRTQHDGRSAPEAAGARILRRACINCAVREKSFQSVG